jgi:hypothetical protein
MGEDPVIWVTPVIPESDLSITVLSDGVPENVQSYWRHNQIKSFLTLRPYMKDPNETNQMLIWTEKTVIESEFVWC